MAKLYPLDKLNIKAKENPKLCKHYVYTYVFENQTVYAGRGSDAHLSGTKQFARARDIEGHSHCVPAGIDLTSENFEIYIISMASDLETIRNIEATYIQGFNLVEEGWNNRQEIQDSKFYNIIEAVTNPDPNKRSNIKTLTHILMKNSTGAKGTEPMPLVHDILSKISVEDKNVCVVGNEMFGGFNFVSELVTNKYPYESITTICSEEMVMKIGADNTMDENFLSINTGVENFLNYNFGNKKFDVIIMNPPWTTLGIQFIEKAVTLLKSEGKLVTVIGLDQFSPVSYDNAHKNGTFWWLNQKGTFERIETARHDGAYGTKKFFDSGNGAACWFIWRKEKTDISTVINNKLGEEFSFKLTGEEWMVPEEPYDKIKDFVDWSKDAVMFKGSPSNSKVNKSIFRFKLGLNDGFTEIKKQVNCSLILGELREKLDKYKIKKFFSSEPEVIRRKMALYSRFIVSHLRHYPVKKELFLKDEFIGKDI